MTNLKQQRGARILLVALATFVLNTQEAIGTTIVAIRTPVEIAIAADSMGIFLGKGPESTKPVCKIFTVVDAAFAVSGLTKNPARGFDAETLVARVLARRRSILEAVDQIEAELRTGIGHELGQQKQHEPDLFAKSIGGEGGYVTSVLIATLEGDTLVAVGIGFKAATSTSGAITVSPSRLACPGDCPSGVFTFYLGERRPIDRYIREHGHGFAMSPAAASPFFVRLVIEAGLPGVGPPIDVLVISKQGISWPSVKRPCGGPPSGYDGPNEAPRSR